MKKRITKVLPLLFAGALIAGLLAVAGGFASAAPNCSGTANQKALCHAKTTPKRSLLLTAMS
ncbi:hypothetical protein GA0074695_0580 [Micromonospora viridifaciens]|uniref:Uncharacterized protein n=1 Tax=Micromonospora viridifaciens TaxID=1881 RepID=A0A1C4UKD9_MICVI|nr:hypothetical protein [Micromonospora viridifaciens]SCE72107.1 hypothetical protein GA0074695_0580 [Micromonospora viridifaciens]